MGFARSLHLLGIARSAMRSCSSLKGTQLRRVASGLACCVALGLGSPAALTAAQLTAPTVSTTGTQSTIDECGPPRLFQYAVALQSQSACSFTSRFRSTFGVDVRALGSTHTLTRSSNHRVNFSIQGVGPTEAWQAIILHERRGSLIVRQDGGKCGFATLSPITATLTGPGTLNSSLSTNANYDVCNCNDCGDDCPGIINCSGNQSSSHTTAVNESKQATLSGTGPGSFTVDFTWVATVESQANIAGGGDEAVVRLGMSAAENAAWLSSCDDIMDAAYYSIGQDGHWVSVTVVSDNAVVVLDGMPTKCSPLEGQPCTYTASGTVEGCLGNNYTVFLDYLDASGNIVCSTSVPVTDGNPAWTSEVTCPGTCDGVAVDVSATNDPGIAVAPLGARRAVLTERGVVLRSAVVGSETCAAIPVPALGRERLGLLMALVLTAGTVVLWRRRQNRAGIG